MVEELEFGGCALGKAVGTGAVIQTKGLHATPVAEPRDKRKHPRLEKPGVKNAAVGEGFVQTLPTSPSSVAAGETEAVC
jgi:hypothetical protein